MFLKKELKKWLRLTSFFALAMGLSSCEKDEDAAASAENDVKPGALVLKLDSAMGSIAFEGQAAALANADWADTHCDAERTVAEAFQEDSSIFWGCNLTTVTNGPDTPRGGLNRVKQITCSIDKAVEAGEFKFDDAEHTFKIVIDEECWGKEFAEMAANEMKELKNADGFIEVDLTVTSYATVPATWSSTPADWAMGLDIDFGFTPDDTMNYKLMMASSDKGVAAAILSVEEGEDPEVFAISIASTGGADDEHDFRYEGRFPYGMWGSGGYGSRHVRTLITGPYAGDGGFTSITSGVGYEASMYGTNNSETLQSGRLRTFMSTTAGIGAKDFPVNASGELNGSATETGEAGINTFTFTASATEKPSFLTTDVAAFTGAEDWFKANGPIDFKEVVVAD
jgi:hypothetical protein